MCRNPPLILSQLLLLKKGKGLVRLSPVGVHGVLHWTGARPLGLAKPTKVLPSHLRTWGLQRSSSPQATKASSTSSPVTRYGLCPYPLLCTALIKATRCLQPRLLLETQLSWLLWLDSVEHFLQPLAVLWHNLLVCKLGATLIRPEHKPLRDSQLTLTWMLCRDHIRKKRGDIQQNVLKIYLILSTSHFLKPSKQLKPSTSLKVSFQMRWDKRIPGLY